MAPVREIASSELQADAVRISTAPEAAAAEARVATLLKRPLTPTSAMQVALLNNRGLQAAYNELGIAEAQAVQASLPALPLRIRSLREVEAQALDRRLDLQVARLELDALAKSLGLTQATRFVTDLDLAAQDRYKSTDKYSTDSVSKTKTITDGFVAGIEIPLFDFGGARVAEAEQRYLRAANRLAEMAVNAHSEAREAYHAYRGAYAVARATQDKSALQALPGPQAALQFVSLSSEGSNTGDGADAIAARRDFWIASATLDAVLVGDGSGPGAASPAPPD